MEMFRVTRMKIGIVLLFVLPTLISSELGVLSPKYRKLWIEDEADLFCGNCSLRMDEILKADSEDLVLNKTLELCLYVYGDALYCAAYVEMNAPELVYIQQNSPANATGADYCGIVYVGFGCETEDPSRVWEVTLPDVPKPPVVEPPLAGEEKPTLKILHLSDPHYDPSYFPGSDTSKCPENNYCCREEYGITSVEEDAAGFWGDYRLCDLPIWTLEAIYQHIAVQHPDIDFILWTGDLASHDMIKLSKPTTLEAINVMADLVSEYFPGITVYPTLGNHDTYPFDLYPQPYVEEPEFDVSWLYDELTTIWSRWLPSEAATSVAYGGYYSAQIRPGLRILSVNTNYCHGDNFWLLLDSTDIAESLSLMAKELQAAEDEGENVYIISHIAPGDESCTLTWSHEFNRIISRYESTVSGIFYGHTHVDNFQLFFDPDNSSRVYEIGYIAPSQTTYADLNPGYRIYTVEGDFVGSKYRVLNHENWILNLSLSNSLNRTVFSMLYSAKDDYGLVDLSPKSWLDFVYTMNEPNSQEFDQFYRNFVKGGDPSMEEGCNEDCKSSILCGLLISDNSDHSHCNSLLRHNKNQNYK